MKFDFIFQDLKSPELDIGAEKVMVKS